MGKIDKYVLTGVNAVMRQIDGSKVGWGSYSYFFEDIERHGRKVLPPKTVPKWALLAWADDEPSSGEVVTPAKKRDAVFSVWADVSVLCYEAGWGRTRTQLFDNAGLRVDPTLMRVDNVTVPAIELSTYAMEGSIVLGVMARYPQRFNAQMAEAVCEALAETVHAAE